MKTPVVVARSSRILRGDALDLIGALTTPIDLVVTDPPYAFDESGDEHALTATVAIVLREAAQRLRSGRWMVVFCASSWRSQAYMVEAVRGVMTPIRSGTWCKPAARTKARTPGWAWASVHALAFRKGASLKDIESSGVLDHVTAAPMMNGRRAELPRVVADWAVAPYAVSDGLMLDPFCGSGAPLDAAERAGMTALGYERMPR